jgi:hypothetical protein
MKFKKVFLDIDGVLNFFGEYFLDYLGIEDKTPPEKWSDSRYVDNMHRIVNDVDFWLNIPAIDYKEIKFEVSGYCTARPIPSSVTEEWLLRNGFPKAPVYTVGLNGSKLKVLKEQGCEIFLDDAAHNFKELNDGGIKTYLLTRSHNKNIKTNLRVDSIQEFYPFTKKNILVLGHKEHGKSTFAELICKNYNLTSKDSSLAAAEIFIYNVLKDKYGYNTFEECFNDRRKRRKEWFKLIQEYNANNETRLAEQILLNNDIYVGMRREKELICSIEKGLFSNIIGIYDPRKSLENFESMDIDIFKYSDYIVYNNLSLNELNEKSLKLNLQSN